MEYHSRKRNNNNNFVEKNGVQNGSTPIDKSCKCQEPNGLHCFTCKSVPDHLRLNPYIHSGYRADLTTRECLNSLFYLHNESFNIYSHGLAAIALVLLSPYVYSKTTLLEFDPFLYPIHHITCTTCVLFSAIYHLMSCHDGGKHSYTCFITLDYLGIWVVTTLGCITFLKATFFCIPQVHRIVTAVYFAIGFVIFVYIVKTTNSKIKLMLLVVLGTIRILFLYPARCIMRNIGYTTGPLGTIWYLLGVEMIGLVGGIINHSYLPERWCLGKVDYFFNSHNIMHVVVLIAPVFSHCGTVMDFEWMKNAKCPIWEL